MKKRFIISVAIIMSVSLVGCGSSTVSTKSSKKTVQTKQTSTVNDEDIVKPIEGKVKAINDKKINDYMSSFIKETDTYKSEKNEMTRYLQNYTVKASIEDEKVLNRTSKDAQVQYVVNTEKVKGPSFLDNKALYVSNLQNVNGEWKISSENILKTEYKNNIFNTVYDNISALNKKDINAYMATIDPTDTNVYSKFKDDQLDRFDKNDLTYTLESADIIGSLDDKDTAVQVVETVVKNDNSDYQNNRTTLMYQIKKVQGTWKIYKVETKKTENIN